MANTIKYLAELSDEHHHSFILVLEEADEDDMWSMALWEAMRAIGSDPETTFYEDLKSGRRRQFNVALTLTQSNEAVKAAYQTEQVRWLIARGATFDVQGKAWAPGSEAPEVLLLIPDINEAMLFKLTFGGAV